MSVEYFSIHNWEKVMRASITHVDGYVKIMQKFVFNNKMIIKGLGKTAIIISFDVDGRRRIIARCFTRWYSPEWVSNANCSTIKTCLYYLVQVRKYKTMRKTRFFLRLLKYLYQIFVSNWIMLATIYIINDEQNRVRITWAFWIK